MADTSDPQNGRRAIADLLHALADLFGAEGREGGDQSAHALIQAADNLPDLRPLSNPYEPMLHAALSDAPAPIASAIRAAMPFIRWGASDLRNGRIPDDLSEAMPMCELVGPDGMMPADHVRVGLWMQSLHVVYGPRHHLAEETFLIFAGAAEWQQSLQAPQMLEAGAVVHHPSDVSHTSTTRARPVMAAWRWSGDIRFEGYALE